MSRSMHTDLVLDALEQALWARSCDNAPAETIIGLYKTELIRRRGPWRGLDEVEYATLEWVDWFNHRRLLEPIGHLPPAEFEAAHWRTEAPGSINGLKQPCLR